MMIWHISKWTQQKSHNKMFFVVHILREHFVCFIFLCVVKSILYRSIYFRLQHLIQLWVISSVEQRTNCNWEPNLFSSGFLETIFIEDVKRIDINKREWWTCTHMCAFGTVYTQAIHCMFGSASDDTFATADFLLCRHDRTKSV